MANQRKKNQKSNQVLITQLRQEHEILLESYGKLQDAFNGLLQKLTQRDEVNNMYFAAVAEALMQVAPDKFTGPDGKPLNVYLEFLKKQHPELVQSTDPRAELQPQNDEAFKLEVTTDGTGN